MLKLASWNVNSLKVRLDYVLKWFDDNAVDILALQETKLVDEQFPLTHFTEKGYHVIFSGQKTYNGVAIISRYPIDEFLIGLPDYDDPQRRVLTVTTNGIRLINLYVPNGSEVGSDKYHYKLAWLEKTHQFIEQQLKEYPKVAVVGDFNIAPEDCDVHDPAEWQNCILVSDLERQALRNIMNLGLSDSFRMFPQEADLFSWWDYRAAGFRRNRGLRIDHILLNDALQQQCKASSIDKEPRKWERPSDHAPVYVVLD